MFGTYLTLKAPRNAWQIMQRVFSGLQSIRTWLASDWECSGTFLGALRVEQVPNIDFSRKNTHFGWFGCLLADLQIRFEKLVLRSLSTVKSCRECFPDCKVSVHGWYKVLGDAPDRSWAPWGSHRCQTLIFREKRHIFSENRHI